jgi:hypothetical protein
MLDWCIKNRDDGILRDQLKQPENMEIFWVSELTHRVRCGGNGGDPVFVSCLLSTTDTDGLRDLSNTYTVSCKMSIIRCRIPHVGARGGRMSVMHELLQVVEGFKPDGFDSENLGRLYLNN